MLNKKCMIMMSLMHCFNLTQCMAPQNGQQINLTNDVKNKLMSVINVPCVVRFKGLDEVAAVAFSNNGQQVAGGSTSGVIKIWDLQTNKCTKKFKAGDRRAHYLRFSHTGQRLAISRQEPALGAIEVWDIGEETPGRVLTLDKNAFYSVFSPHDDLLVFNERDCTQKHNYISLWNLWDDECARLFPGTVKSQHALVFSHNGALLAAGLEKGNVVVRTMEDGTLRTLQGHESDVLSVVFSDDNQHLISLSHDSFRLWDMTNFECSMTIRFNRLLENAILSPATSAVTGFSGSSLKNLLKVLQLQINKSYSWLAHKDPVKCLAFSPDGNRLVSGSKAVRVWNIESSNNLLAKLHNNDFTPEQIAVLTRYVNNQKMTQAQKDQVVGMGFRLNDSSLCTIQ